MNVKVDRLAVLVGSVAWMLHWSGVLGAIDWNALPHSGSESEGEGRGRYAVAADKEYSVTDDASDDGVYGDEGHGAEAYEWDIYGNEGYDSASYDKDRGYGAADPPSAGQSDEDALGTGEEW